MITKLDDCFKNFPEEITEGINTTIKLINDYKDYDDRHHSNWSFLLFPIFTSLEGIMQISLKELGIEIKRNFFCFHKENNKYKLNSYIKYKDFNKSKYIENCYNIYVNHRHKYFHYQRDKNSHNRFKIEKNLEQFLFLIKFIY